MYVCMCVCVCVCVCDQATLSRWRRTLILCAPNVSDALIRVCHDSFIRVTWLVHMCDMTHPYVRHAVFMCAQRLSAEVSCVWHDSFTCVTWRIDSFISLIYWCGCRIHVCDTPDSWVGQSPHSFDTFQWERDGVDAAEDEPDFFSDVYLTCIVHTQAYVWHDSSICAPRYFGAPNMICVRRHSFVCVTWLYVLHDSFRRVTWRIHMSGLRHL